MPSFETLVPRTDRVEAKTVRARQQRAMARIAHDAIREYLRVVLEAVSHTAVTAAGDGDLGPDIDLNALDQTAAWPQILADTILPELVSITTGLGPQQYLTATVVNSVDAWRAKWLQERTQVLVGVADTITKDLRDAITADNTEHGPNPQRTAATVKAYLDPDAPMWKGRAQTIARTEVIGANNQGGLASWRAIHESIQHLGGQVFKTWLATEDSHTRPDHAAIDGTEVGIGGSFSVGGTQMDGPGDNSAPADEVINCRCTLTYRVDDGADAPVDDATVDADETLTAAAGSDAPTGVAVLLMLSADDAATLAVDGGEAPETMHVTLGYLRDPASEYTDDVKTGILDGLAPLADMLPVTADAFATAHFNPEDDERDPCAVVLVQSDDLASIHDGVSDAIASMASTTFPIWIPHVTVAYNADPSVIPAGVVGGQLSFDRLVLAWASDQITVTNPPATPDQAVTAAVEAPVTAPAPTTDAPPQPSDGTPTEAAPQVIPGAMQWEGVLAMVDTPSSDGRMIRGAGFSVRGLPLPLKYQALGSHGGEESGTTEIVGRILSAEVRGEQVWATGDFFDPTVSYCVTPAMEQVAAGIGCVSVDLPALVVSYLAPGPDGTLLPVDPMQYPGDPYDLVMVAEESELAAATIVDVPAFGDARINLVADPSAPNLAPVTADAASPQAPVLTSESITFPDGTVLSVGDQVSVIDPEGGDPKTGLIETISPETNEVTVAVEDGADGTTSVTVDAGQLDIVEGAVDDATEPDAGTDPAAAAQPLTAAIAFPGLTEEHTYPADWFEPLELDGPTRLRITDEGRVYGHLTQAGSCHLGFANECVSPPESPTNYAYFHTGEVKTDKGLIAAGRITVGGGHANIQLGWRGTIEHYDNASSVGAVVRAYRDEHGIQLAGALLPNATKEQVAALRRSPLSGDWRVIGGHRELVVAHCVNDPGFPIAPRAALAADGSPRALVAAGVIYDPPVQIDVTLPSGAKLSPADVAVLAAAFAEVADQRTAEALGRQRARDVSTMRRKIERDALKSQLRSVS